MTERSKVDTISTLVVESLEKQLGLSNSGIWQDGLGLVVGGERLCSE